MGFIVRNIGPVVTVGPTYTVPNQTSRVFVNPASVVAALAVMMAPAPVEGDAVEIIFGGTVTIGQPVVTALSIVANAGQSLFQNLTPTTANSGDVIRYVYQDAGSRWVREV